MISAQYITEIKAKLLASPAVRYVAIVKERTLVESGYSRARYFPHPVHIGEESNVEPSCSMNILELNRPLAKILLIKFWDGLACPSHKKKNFVGWASSPS